MHIMDMSNITGNGIESSNDEMMNCFLKLCFIGERAKRARHSQVCSIENRDICIYPLRGERAHSLKLFGMYDKRFEISKTK